MEKLKNKNLRMKSEHPTFCTWHDLHSMSRKLSKTKAKTKTNANAKKTVIKNDEE
jgi:hypothetical protein